MSKAVIKERNIASGTADLDNLPVALQKIYRARGVSSLQQLDYNLARLPSPALLKSNLLAASILAEAILQQKRLLIIADFDVDGATSCALVKLALESMGAEYVSYLVPDRFKFGYGLTTKIVDVAAEYSPDIIITVDNGISSIDGVERANALGIDVLITDHHLPAKTLPEAKAIVNPNQPGCSFPSKALAGVGVAFYLLLAVRKQLRELGWFSQGQVSEPNLSQFLDLVALGTIADIVPLDHCNRILVKQGLKRIRGGQCRAGILALLNLANRESNRIQASDLGFYVGPRLNAAGRLDDMSVGIECLLSEETDTALEFATILDALNRERREIEGTMQEQALNTLEKLFQNEKLHESVNFGLCLYQSEWHQGIIGLLASRIKDKIHRPVIVFADVDPEIDTDELKGSARSISGLHLKDILDSIATNNPQLLQKFGGHAMAAGMTIKKQHLQEFSTAFDAAVAVEMGGQLTDNIIWSDGELSANEISIELAREIRCAGPWGQAFEEPAFHGNFNVLSSRVLAGKHLKLQLENHCGNNVDAIAFSVNEELLDIEFSRVKLLYKLNVNYFRQQESLQLMIEHIVLL